MILKLALFITDYLRSCELKKMGVVSIFPTVLEVLNLYKCSFFFNQLNETPLMGFMINLVILSADRIPPHIYNIHIKRHTETYRQTQTS